MSYFGVSTRNGVGLGLGTVPSLTNTLLGYRLAPSLDLSFAGSDALSPAITFSRTTNATLTNSSGLIANAPMNLLTFSEQFDNAAWTKLTATVAANVIAAPNGTTTADKLIPNAGAQGYVLQSPSVNASQQYVYSIYLKAAEYSTVRLQVNNGASSILADVNLANGTISAVTGSLTGSSAIVAVGDGWFRASLAYVAANTTASQHYTFYLPNGNGTSGFYLWGAQLELGSTATTYNPTTVKNLLGFTENFDNAAWTKSNSFVQTNLVPYSEELDTGWTNGTGATWQYNSGVSPIGTVTALGVDGLSGIALINTGTTLYRGNITISGSTAYTFSVYVRSKTGTADVVIRMAEGGGNNTVSPSATVTTEWTRLSLSATTAAGVTSLTVAVGTGSGTADLFIWGAQLVQGTTPGDYKATYAAAAAVGYPDIYGQPFAQKLVETVGSALHFTGQTPTIPAAPLVVSFYAKAAERTRTMVRDNSISGAFSIFDLSAGTVVTNSGGMVGTITDVGSGWYRCSTLRTYVVAGGSQFGIFVLPSTATTFADATYTGDGTSGIYIFGAQLSDSASVDPYVYQPVAAPTSTAYYGPRFDYDPVTLAPKGLLIEEQRTNLLTYSEDFTNAAWFKDANRGSFATNAVSPSGSVTAQTLTAGSANFGYAYRTVTTTIGSSYAFSFYAKAGTSNFAYLEMCGLSASYVNLTTLAVSAASGVTITATSVGSGWVRIVGVATASATSHVFSFGGSAASGSQAFPSGNTVLFYGAQLEAGSFATSYIPTVASQVTRAADIAVMRGNNFLRWYNQTTGTFAATYEASPNAFTSYFVASNGVTAQNSVHFDNDSGNMRVVYYSGSSAVATLGLGARGTVGAVNKVASAYAVNDFAASRNAGTVVTDTSGAVPVALTQLNIGADPSGAATNVMNTCISRIAYYNRRLANSELIGITS